ncbi:restriction endonuclease subunit S [bacterium]|nr:restriction endonuclease subunit S [bacterium]
MKKRLGNKDWEIKKLGDVCEVINGKNQKAVEDKNGSYPIYGSGGIMGYASEYLCRENTTIIGRKGSINNPLYVEEKFWNVDTAFGFQSKDNYLPKLLFYFCKSFDFSTHNKGTTIPSLVKSDLLEIPIPVPPLEEQKRIVKILDEKFAQLETIKANAQTNLQNAKDLFQSQLTKAFSNTTWEKKKVSEISENLDSKRIPITKNVRKTGQYPYYGASGIVDYVEDYIFDGKFLLVSEDGANLLARTSPIAFIAEGKFWVNNHAHILSFKDEITMKFVELFFSNLDISPYVTGMAQPKFNQAPLNNIEIPLPPLPEQKRIVKELDTLSEKVKALQNIYEQMLLDCEELKQSFLCKAFAGEL